MMVCLICYDDKLDFWILTTDLLRDDWAWLKSNCDMLIHYKRGRMTRIRSCQERSLLRVLTTIIPMSCGLTKANTM